jgi:hypothetical protein
MKNCPKCDADITENYQGYDPDVGIMSSGWYCEACDLFIDEEDWPDEEPYDRDGYGSGSDGS